MPGRWRKRKNRTAQINTCVCVWLFCACICALCHKSLSVTNFRPAVLKNRGRAAWPVLEKYPAMRGFSSSGQSTFAHSASMNVWVVCQLNRTRDGKPNTGSLLAFSHFLVTSSGGEKRQSEQGTGGAKPTTAHTDRQGSRTPWTPSRKTLARQTATRPSPRPGSPWRKYWRRSQPCTGCRLSWRR